MTAQLTTTTSPDTELQLVMPSREYALGAIATLKRQFDNARSENRKEKLAERIERWEVQLPRLPASSLVD